LELRLSNPTPSSVAPGEYVSFDLTVVNQGDATARQILVEDRFDQGLSHEGDRDKRNRIENSTIRDLGPGESAPLTLTFRVEATGTLCHEVTVSAEGATPVTRRGCVTVQQAAVQVQVRTMLQQVVGSTTDYAITVRNTGGVPATNLELIQTFTTALQAVPMTAEQTVGQDGSIRIAIPRLTAGEVRQFTTRARCVAPAAQACSRVTVTIGGNAVHQENACLEILQQMP
jgi:uncharacterized repeat protein (TIGR01451 family)